MEGSQDVYYKEKTVSPEKIKRKMKTPAQVEALEKFYNEHKYPSEPMKLQFAEQIGLSEKQVSGWFCHRRLKDKKLMQGEFYANGKHYNGVVHDRTSGLRQESCSSTKQGDKYFDLKEVESKRSYGQSSSSAVLALEQRGRQFNVGCHASADDRSSGSSSASQGRLLQQVEDPSSLVSSGYPSQGDKYMLNTRGVNSRRPMMHSRCSYFQVENEHPAISSVKRKLGRHYCEDGPPLGVNFDPLPPGAFDSLIRDSNFEPYYVGDPMLHGASCIPRITKETKVYDKYRHEELSNSSYPGAIGFRKSMHGFVDQDGLLGCQLNSKASLTKQSGSVQKRLMGKIEDFAGKTSDYNSQSNKRRAKYRTKEGENSVGHLFHINGQKAYTNKAFPYPHNPYNYSSQVFQREEFKECKFSKSACKSNNFLDTEDVLMPRRPLKKLGRKVSSMQFQQQEYVTKSSEKHSRRKPVIRNNGNMATTLSEDETVGTASSVD